MKKLNSSTILIFILFVSSFFNVFVSKSINEVVIFIISLILLIYNIKKKKFVKNSIKKKDTLIIITLTSLIFMFFYFLLGKKTGYEVNYSAVYKGFIKPSVWIPMIGIMIVSELLRYIYVPKEEYTKKKKYIPYALLMVSFILIDVMLSQQAYEFNGIVQIFKLFSIVIAGSIFKNILLSYVSQKSGYIPCIIYRIIMDLYILVVPFTPQVNMYLESIIMIVYPYLVYSLLKEINHEITIKDIKPKRNVLGKLFMIIVCVLLGTLVCLVSKEFKYAMVAIGSESMSNAINKGDAVIYKTYDKETDNLKEGIIIVYKHNGVILVHRIVKINYADDTLIITTRGDANPVNDLWTVFPEDILGIVTLRIRWIGIPSVLISELL